MDNATGTERELTGPQIAKGLVILALFVVLRLLLVRIWEHVFGGEYHLSLPFTGFMFGIFLVMSVGLVYFGFTRWVGVDLKAWWFSRARILGDVVWAIATLGGLAVIAVAALLILIASGLQPPDWVTANQPSLDHLAGMLVFGWFFGFAIAAFQEETLFRGFVQRIVANKLNRWPANLIQAALFSVAHLGLEPFLPIGRTLFALALRFIFGILFGWLRDRRGSLLTPAIVHGFMG